MQVIDNRQINIKCFDVFKIMGAYGKDSRV